MDVAKFAAWWGAVLSTVVFAWDIWKYRRAGPRLRLEVSTGMQGVNMPQYKGKMLIMANATNYGDRPTTITHLAFQGYERKWRFLKKKDCRAERACPSPEHLAAGSF